MLLTRRRALIWSLAAGALAAGAGCATTAKDASERRKEALAAKIWDEKSPYGFHRAVTMTLLRTGQAERAVPHLQALLGMQPDEPEPHYLMARTQLLLGLRGDARRELGRALVLAEKHAPSHALLGVLLDQTGKSKEAEKHHRRSVTLAPRHAGYRNNLGFCLSLQGRHHEATKVYHEALALDPSMRRVHNNLGFAYAAMGRMARAYRHFQIGGQAAQADNNMGYAHERRGELQQALDYYLRAAKEAPDLERIRQNLARVCKRLGKPLPQLLPSPEPKDDSGGKGS